jgi:hypothetical protein
MFQFVYHFVGCITFLHGILSVVAGADQTSTIITDEVRNNGAIRETFIYEAIRKQESTTRKNNDGVDNNLMTTLSAEDEHHHHDHGRMSILNMTCDFFTQPLNHFVPRGRSPTYEERYCTYDGFVLNNDDDSPELDTAFAPIFFYTGNESPLEQYINQVKTTIRENIVFTTSSIFV